jgi:hypothetical protein
MIPNSVWFPFYTDCDPTCDCLHALASFHFIVNPTVAAQPTDWGAIKNLYRSP